jgi:hypothetical protein
MTNFLYTWERGSGFSSTMARLPTSGLGPNELEWIKSLTEKVGSIAVSSTHIYWSSDSIEGSPKPSINRAQIDGTEVEKEWITLSGGAGYIPHIVIDENYLYYANTQGGESTVNEIGRMRLDGSEKVEKWISIPSQAPINAIAVNKEYIYWTGFSVLGFGARRLGRAQINGSEVKDEWSKEVTGTVHDMVATNTHIYMLSETSITRVSTSGVVENLWYEFENPTAQGLTTAGNFLYFVLWYEIPEKGFVGRMHLDKTNVEEEWLSLGSIFGGQTPQRLTITPEEAPCVKPTDSEAPWELYT